MPADDAMLTGLAAMIVVLLAVVFGLILLAKRTGHPRVALILGALGALYFVVTAIDTMLFCNGGPGLFGWVGRPAAAAPRCDGAGGVLSYAYALLAAPCAALALGAATVRDWYEWRDRRSA